LSFSKADTALYPDAEFGSASSKPRCKPSVAAQNPGESPAVKCSRGCPAALPVTPPSWAWESAVLPPRSPHRGHGAGVCTCWKVAWLLSITSGSLGTGGTHLPIASGAPASTPRSVDGAWTAAWQPSSKTGAVQTRHKEAFLYQEGGQTLEQASCRSG